MRPLGAEAFQSWPCLSYQRAPSWKVVSGGVFCTDWRRLLPPPSELQQQQASSVKQHGSLGIATK